MTITPADRSAHRRDRRTALTPRRWGQRILCAVRLAGVGLVWISPAFIRPAPGPALLHALALTGEPTPWHSGPD